MNQLTPGLSYLRGLVQAFVQASFHDRVWVLGWVHGQTEIQEAFQIDVHQMVVPVTQSADSHRPEGPQRTEALKNSVARQTAEHRQRGNRKVLAHCKEGQQS